MFLSLLFYAAPTFAADTPDLQQLYGQLGASVEVRTSPEDLGNCDYVSDQAAMISDAVKALQDSDLKVIPWVHSFYKGDYSFVDFTLKNGQHVRFMFDREYGSERIDAALQLPGQPDLIWIDAAWSIHRELFKLARKIRTPTVTLEMVRRDENYDPDFTEDDYLRSQQERLSGCNGWIDRPSRFRDHGIPQTCRGQIPYHYIYDGKDPESCPNGWVPDPYLEGVKP